MNDLTIEEVSKGEEVFFYLKPSDKLPHCISKITWLGFDDRDRQFVELQGVGMVPIYHIKKLPEDDSLIRLYSSGVKETA